MGATFIAATTGVHGQAGTIARPRSRSTAATTGVRRVEPSAFTKVSALGVEEQRVNVIVDLTSPPERWRALGHGYQVNARIVVSSGEGLVVPLSALFRTGTAWTVFVVDGGRAQARTVTLAARST